MKLRVASSVVPLTRRHHQSGFISGKYAVFLNFSKRRGGSRQAGYDNPTAQESPGHVSVATTTIYMPVMNRGGRGVASPAGRRAPSRDAGGLNSASRPVPGGLTSFEICPFLAVDRNRP